MEGRNAAIGALLERGANVEFDVPALPVADGVIEDFTTPSNVKGININLYLSGDNSCLDVESSTSLDSKIVDNYTKLGLSMPFADFSLLHFDRRTHDPKQLISILRKSIQASVGSINYAIVSGKFGSVDEPSVVELIKVLKEKGADINYKNDRGETALGYLMNRGLSDGQMKVMTDLGADM